MRLTQQSNLASITSGMVALSYGVNLNNRTLTDYGFGSINPNFLIRFHGSATTGLLSATLIANSPQLLLSFLYFAYNGILTGMLMAREWDRYGSQRKFIRVSTPSGFQRSTYWLHMPYRYGIPQLIISALTHWILSESLFLVAVNKIPDMSDLQQAERSNQVLTAMCGYSPLAAWCCIGLALMLVALTSSIGYRRYSDLTPMVGSCSAAISAACHPSESDIDPSSKKLKFGQTTHGDLYPASDVPLHCSLTSFEVVAPVVGKLYA